ncbi:MAG TPA: polysaccharide biosynthesis tyrosine autokinase [Lunatimonas sp.]|nr:polysaccharide biosynthesis tyrosine autokinase [Lunatimonas sp.]
MVQDKTPYPFREQPSGEPDIRGLLLKYLQYWPYILISVAIGVTMAVLFNKYSTPIYLVKSTILVSSESSPLSSMDIFESNGKINNSNSLKLNNEVGILKSYTIARETIESLDLQIRYYKEGLIRKTQIYGGKIVAEVDWSHPQLVGGEFIIEVIDDRTFALLIPEEEKFKLYQPIAPYEDKVSVNGKILPEEKHLFGEWIEGESFKFKISKLSADPGEKIYISILDSHSLALSFRKNLMVEPLYKETSILELSIQTPIKKLGEDYLNALMRTYQARELDEKNRTSENTIKFIGEQLTGITDSLSFFENRLQEYRSDNKVFDLSSKGTAIFRNLEDQERQVREAELQIQYYNNLKAYISLDKLDSLMVPSVVGIGDPLLNALVVDLVRLQGEKISLSSSLRQEINASRELTRKIEYSKRTILENVESAKGNLEQLLVEFRKNIRSIEGEINQLPETERKLLGIQRQFSINENIYLYLLQKQAEAEISKAANTPSHQILDMALSDGGAISPRSSRNLMMGLMLGFFLPIGIITLWNAFNSKITDLKEVEKALNIPVIGSIPNHKVNIVKVVYTQPQSGITESFRSVRANMAYLHPAQAKITFLFTSFVPGEGKTFCSINMAAIYALMGKKTVLVGLDLRKPKIAENFGLQNDVGISTCLSTDLDWRTMIKPSGYKHLDILLSGPPPPNPGELLVQEKFKRILQEIKEEYDVVVLDSSPIGLVSETMDLINLADVKIIVLRQGYSDKHSIDAINNLKEKSQVEKLYAIINGVQKNNTYGYGYSYGTNGYAYGYLDDEKEIPWWKRKLKAKTNKKSPVKGYKVIKEGLD